MKNLSNHWYKAIGLACSFLFLIMVYRREARMRTHIEEMEARIEALELYAHGKENIRNPELTTDTKSNNPSSENKTTPKQSQYPRKSDSGKTYSRQDSTPRSAENHNHFSNQEEEHQGKFRQVVKLELNTIDSATLVKVPGIGEGTARSILQYREKLGGYYSSEQLREKLTWESAQTHLDSWCNEWFWADENLIRKLQINILSFKDLVHHPYLEYEEVKAIVKWRDRHEKVHNTADLEQIGIDDSTKLEKLLHYVEF